MTASHFKGQPTKTHPTQHSFNMFHSVRQLLTKMRKRVVPAGGQNPKTICKTNCCLKCFNLSAPAGVPKAK